MILELQLGSTVHNIGGVIHIIVLHITCTSIKCFLSCLGFGLGPSPDSKQDCGQKQSNNSVSVLHLCASLCSANGRDFAATQNFAPTMFSFTTILMYMQEVTFFFSFNDGFLVCVCTAAGVSGDSSVKAGPLARSAGVK